MKKVKSFSKYGNYLQRRQSLTTNPEILRRTMERAKERPLVVTKSQPKFIEGFDRITDRSQPSGYQMFHTRDKNVQTNYEVKDNYVKTRSAFYPVRHESEVRLNKLIVSKQKYERNECPCEKMPLNERDETILTSRDLHKTRRSFHSMDFNKQLTKSHSYIKKPEGKETMMMNEEKQFVLSKGQSASNFKKIDEKDPMNKTHSVHSFNSYTNRDFLSEKKLSKKGAPPYSGAQSFKIPQQKFKQNWKVIQPLKFETIPSKTMTRYDGDYPWHTKLGYQPKEDLVNKKTLVFTMKDQSPRKMNEVHSKYPIRLAA